MKLTPEDQPKFRDKELANIIRKLKGGMTLTARQSIVLIPAAEYADDWRRSGTAKAEIESGGPCAVRLRDVL